MAVPYSSRSVFGAPLEPFALENVCIALAGNTVAEMLARVAELAPKFLFFEFRLDFLDQPAAALPMLETFLKAHPELAFLATCRPQRSGGRLRGSAQEEFAILLAAAEAGFALVDLSLESAEELGKAALTVLRGAGATVLVSFHDFGQTGDLSAVLVRLRAVQPDISKIVPTAQTLDDTLRLLRFLRDKTAKAPAEPLVAIAMGEAGVLTRILGHRSGSAFTFAAASEADATAPGQLTGRALVDLYRIRDLTPATRLYGVAGDPVRSSLSPLMFNTAFREQAMDAVYVPLLISDPEVLFRAARELPLDGFSVTMPLKQAVIPFLQHVDPLAARIGAVNTVHCTPAGEFHGYNTDAAGIVAPLERRLSLRGARVLVVGAGGAARAAVFGCADRGATVCVTNRTPEKARLLAKEAGATCLSTEALATEHFDVLINATPAGMHGNPRVLPVTGDQLHAELVFDLVYNPAETALLALARERGLETIPGVEMFVHQGARQFEIWTGRSAPIEPMQAAVLGALATNQSVER